MVANRLSGPQRPTVAKNKLQHPHKVQALSREVPKPDAECVDLTNNCVHLLRKTREYTTTFRTS